MAQTVNLDALIPREDFDNKEIQMEFQEMSVRFLSQI